jgi:DNA-nicking Smr family endonuclease
MSRRKLDPEERSIWKHVTRLVKPLAVRPLVFAEDVVAEPPSPPRRNSIKPKPVEPPAPRPTVRPAATPPAPLGRKEKRRLTRAGAIEARLDLHGMTQAQAHVALLRFLHRSQADGAKVVLVITGKGVRGGGEHGVLRRQVPLWLSLPEFRDMIVGFEAAAIAHGGDGAMYVRLRRIRER